MRTYYVTIDRVEDVVPLVDGSMDLREWQNWIAWLKATSTAPPPQPKTEQENLF